MNIIVNLFGKYIVIVDLQTRKVIAVIEYDLGLVKYLLKVLREYVISNNNGYLQFENKTGETYLHRIILEYYSQFDDKLFDILNNSDYEVNHKNKKKWDNRLENLELVTMLNNERHKRGLEYEIVMTSEEIIQICNRLKENKQYNSNKKYLEKVSHRNLEHLKNSNLYWDCKKEFYNNLYIRFSNNTIPTTQITHKPTLSNMLNIFSNTIFMDIKNTFFTPDNTHLITYNYNIYRTKNILNNNLKLIFKYYEKDKYFRKVCNKYKILDHTYIKKDYNNLNYNIIIDLFYFILPNIYERIFYKNQLSKIIALNALILTYKRYNPFRILYI